MATRRQPIALALAIVGLAAGATIYVLAPPEAPNPLEEWEQSKKYESGLERVGGKSAVFGAQVVDFVERCFRGANLGVTVGVLSLVAAGVYLWATRGDARKRPGVRRK